MLAIVKKDVKRKDFLENDIVCIGPLNLNIKEKSASSVLHSDLSLSNEEFEALRVLASAESKTVRFDELAVFWKHEDEARAGINNIIEQIKQAGEGFMWIERLSEEQFVFHTRWGRSYSVLPESKPDDQASPFEEVNADKREKNKNSYRRYYFIALAATVFTILAVLAFTDIIPGEMELTDDPIPIAGTDEPVENDRQVQVTLPDIRDTVVSEGMLSINLNNPVQNEVDLSFELRLTSTNELLYESEKIAPGEEIYVNLSDYEMLDDIQEAQLIINAYMADDQEKEHKIEFNIISDNNN